MRKDDFPIIDIYVKKEINSMLKQIKAEINNLDLGFVDEDYKAGISYAVMMFNQIIDKYLENNC